MTQQYKDIINAIEFEVKEEDKKYAEKYYRRGTLLRVIYIVILVIALYMFMQKIEGRIQVMLVDLVIGYIYVCYRKKFKDRVYDILNIECNPEKELSIYMTLYSHAGKKTKWEIPLYNIGITLFYAGYLEDAKRISELFLRYCKNSLGRGFYEVLCMRIAYQERDAERLNTHYHSLVKLMNDVKLANVLNCKEVIQYPMMLELERKGEEETLYMKCKEAFYGKGILSLVKKNYMLYKVSKKIGLEEASEYRAFVLKNGGTTFYKKELESID